MLKLIEQGQSSCACLYSSLCDCPGRYSVAAVCQGLWKVSGSQNEQDLTHLPSSSHLVPHDRPHAICCTKNDRNEIGF